MDCSGSIKYLLRSICSSYQVGGMRCLLERPSVVFLSCDFCRSKVAEVADKKNNKVALGATRSNHFHTHPALISEAVMLVLAKWTNKAYLYWVCCNSHRFQVFRVERWEKFPAFLLGFFMFPQWLAVMKLETLELQVVLQTHLDLLDKVQHSRWWMAGFSVCALCWDCSVLQTCNNQRDWCWYQH